MSIRDRRPLNCGLGEMSLELHEVVVLLVWIKRLHFVDLLSQSLEKHIYELAVMLRSIGVVLHVKRPASNNDTYANSTITKPLTETRSVLLQCVQGGDYLVY